MSSPDSDDPWTHDLKELVEYLRRVAQRELQDVDAPAPQASSLVGRAFVRLLGGASRFEPQDEEHLRRTAVQAIRFVLKDELRARNAQKRGGGRTRLAMEEVEGSLADPKDPSEGLDAWMDAMEGFKQRAPQAGAIVEHYLLLGTSADVAARDLDVSPEAVSAALLLFQEYCRTSGQR